MDRNRLPSRRGSALILVLWCLLLLGMAVFGVVDMVELSVEDTSHAELLLEARALAQSGLSLGLDSQILADDPILVQTPAPHRHFQTTLSSEGARLNLNYVLLSGHREILVNLFNQWGLSIGDADRVADCLYDWVTPGDLKSLNGAKADDYARVGLTQRPTHKAFATMSEVRLVLGIDLLDKTKADWEDSLTLWSTGPLNVNAAEPGLIAAVFGIDAGRLDSFVSVRNGRDKIVGTQDDVLVSDFKTLQGELGIDDNTMKKLGPQLSLNDTNRRVRCVGQAGDTKVVISAISRLNTSPPQFLLWSEQ